jgi:hypothetical protein
MSGHSQIPVRVRRMLLSNLVFSVVSPLLAAGAMVDRLAVDTEMAGLRQAVGMVAAALATASGLGLLLALFGYVASLLRFKRHKSGDRSSRPSPHDL